MPRRLSIVVGSVIALIALQQPVLAQQKSIRFHEYPGNIVNLVSWVMVERGFCERENLKCEAVLIPAGPIAQQAAAAGSLDLIYSSADVMMQAIAKGNDLMIVQPQIVNNPYTLVTATGATQSEKFPDAVRQLQGKKIGVSARGSATELQAKAILAGVGVPADGATYVAVGAPNTAYAALVAKQVDGALSWDPIAALCQSTHKCTVIVDLRKGEGPNEIKAMNGSFVNWYARREFVDRNQEAIDAFRRASDKATAWLKDPKNFAATMEIASKHLKLGEIENKDAVMKQVVEEMIAGYGTSFKRSSIEGFNQFLVKTGMIPKPLDIDHIVYSKVLNAAR